MALDSDLLSNSRSLHMTLSRVTGRLSLAWPHSRRRDVGALVFILLLCLVLFRDSLLNRQLYSEPDTLTFYFPVMSSVDRALEQSSIPLWTPYIFGGYPLFADGEAGMLYPFNLLLTWLMPIQDAFVWLRVLRFFLAGALTYAFARTVGLAWANSLLAGIVFALGSFMVGQLQHTNVSNSAVWLPLALCFVELALRAQSARRQVFLVLAGVVFGVQSLGVHIQPVLMTWLCLFLYIAFRVVPTRCESAARGPALRSGESAVLRQARHTASRLLLLGWGISVITVVGLGLAAVQLLPLQELGSFSPRGGGVSWLFATLYSLPPHNLVTLIFPYFFTGPDRASWSLWAPTETVIYVGIAPLVLAFVASCFSRTRLSIFLIFLALVSLLLAFGDYLPVKIYSLIWWLPGFSVLRVPARFSYLFVFSCAILAAIGLERLSAILNAHSRKPVGDLSGHDIDDRLLSRNAGHSLLMFAYVTAAITGFVVLALLYVRHWLTTDRAAALKAIQEGYLQLRKHNADLTAESVYRSLDHSLNLANAKTGQSILFLVVVVAIIVLWHRFRTRAGLWQGMLISVTAIDLLLFAGDFHPMVPIESLSSPNGAIRFLADRSGLFRVHNRYPGGRTEPNRMLPFRVASVGGYSSLQTRRHQEFVGAMDRDRRLLNLANIRYVILWAGDKPEDGYALAFRDGDTAVYENDSHLPRAFLVESATVASPGLPALKRMQESDFNPKTTVVLEEPLDLSALQDHSRQVSGRGQLVNTSQARLTANPVKASTEVLDYRPEAVTIRTEATNNSWLVLTDSHYPGWKAYLDGQEVHIYRANYLFRAVYVPAGVHTVSFIFEPWSFGVGRAISLATLLVVVAALSYGLLRVRAASTHGVSSSGARRKVARPA